MLCMQSSALIPAPSTQHPKPIITERASEREMPYLIAHVVIRLLRQPFSHSKAGGAGQADEHGERARERGEGMFERGGVSKGESDSGFSASPKEQIQFPLVTRSHACLNPSQPTRLGLRECQRQVQAVVTGRTGANKQSAAHLRRGRSRSSGAWDAQCTSPRPALPALPG